MGYLGEGASFRYGVFLSCKNISTQQILTNLIHPQCNCLCKVFARSVPYLCNLLWPISCILLGLISQAVYAVGAYQVSRVALFQGEIPTSSSVQICYAKPKGCTCWTSSSLYRLSVPFPSLLVIIFRNLT